MVNKMKKTVFITGASQGLGRTLAGYFAEREYQVAVGYHTNREAAEEIVVRIARQGGRAVAVGGDISDAGEVTRMFATVEEEFGRLDAMINNARFDPSRRQGGIAESDWWDRNLNVSLKGTFLCCLAALEIMKRQKDGAIINVSSIRGVIPNDFNRIPYGAAKAGQISLTRSFAQEAAPFNIRVNAFLPGAIETENFARRVTPEKHRAVCEEIPLRRLGTTEEMSHAIMFLAENTYMTGACLNCSGGLLML